MKLVKRLLIIMLVLFLGVAGYFLASIFFFNKRLHALDVVPPEAIFVYETTEPVLAWNQLVSQPLWDRMADIPSLKGLENQLLALDSLAGRGGELERSLKGNRFVVSLHQTGKEEFDFFFAVAFSGDKQETFLQSLTEKINPRDIYSRSYSEVRIYEYQDPSGSEPLSYALIDNLVLASYSSFLIEDAIRHAESEELKSFRDAYSELFKSQPDPEGLGVLRLSSAGVARFIQGISRGQHLKMMDILSDNELLANLELKFADNKIFLEGESFFGEEKNVNLNWEADGEPHPFRNYISNRTAIYHQYDVTDPLQIKALPTKGFETKGTLMGEMDKSFGEELFFERLTGEVGFMVLEENGLTETDKILLLKTKEVKAQMDLLKEFNLALVGGDPDKLGQVFYQGKEIFAIRAEEFPAHIFEGKFLGFTNTYMMAYDDLLVMGNSVRALRLFLDDRYNDNTWGKSIHHKKFLESRAKGSVYDLLINVPRFWSSIVRLCSPDWKVFFQKYAPQFKSIDWIGLQRFDESTVITLEYNLDPIKSVTDIILAESMAISFNEQLLYGPKAVQNFNDKSSDYLVQDEMHQVHLVTDDGAIVFSQQVEGEIVGDIFQIDYYKNGKLQILFATANAIYAIDRLGTFLPGFPIRIPPGETISHLNVVDYDNNLDYRFFVGTNQGNLYLFDKNGSSLEGWSPRNISGKPATTPAHHRLSGSGDFMVAINNAGNLYLMNRKGELKTGVPIKLGDGVSTDYALVERGSASGTQLVTVNDEGEVVRVNFKGELTYRNQLLRPDRNTRFHLVNDQSNHRYLTVLHEYNKIAVLHEDAEILFEKGIFSDELDFQFFSFGGDKNIFVVIDKVQEFIYLYNLKGELLNTRPINGSEKVEIQYSGSNNEYSILAIHGNRLSEYKMPL